MRTDQSDVCVIRQLLLTQSCLFCYQSFYQQMDFHIHTKYNAKIMRIAYEIVHNGLMAELFRIENGPGSQAGFIFAVISL